MSPCYRYPPLAPLLLFPLPLKGGEIQRVETAFNAASTSVVVALGFWFRGKVRRRSRLSGSPKRGRVRARIKMNKSCGLSIQGYVCVHWRPRWDRRAAGLTRRGMEYQRRRDDSSVLALRPLGTPRFEFTFLSFFSPPLLLDSIFIAHLPRWLALRVPFRRVLRRGGMASLREIHYSRAIPLLYKDREKK